MVLIGLGACGGDDAPADDPDAGIDAAIDAPDPTAALFDPAHVVEVAIEMPEADWDEVRTQTRPGDVLMGADCQAMPFGSPFTARSATVTIDGHRLEQVGVRKKGFLGSLDDDKPSLKLKLDDLVDGQAVAGVRSLTLNNNRQDPSNVRQCLTYRLFAAAGVPAPRCNFAHVTINGRDLGVFTHVESVGKPLLRRHFTSDTGRLYEGTLADFRDGWLATFEPKTDEANPDRSDLQAVATALAAPDGQLLAALAPVIDVDRFISFWAMETLVDHVDGYAGNTNNFFVYRDPATARFGFLPWGTDGTLRTPGTDPPSLMAEGVLARRLYLLPETRARYVARMTELLDTVWDAPARRADLDRMEAQLSPLLAGDPFADGVDVAAAIDEVRAFIDTRRARLAPVLAAPPPLTRPLRSSYCFIELGPIHATFATTFKHAEPPDVFLAGSGTITGSIAGAPIASTRTGSNAAPADDGHVAVQLFALESPTAVLVAVVNLAPSQLAPGTVPIEVFSSYVFRFDLMTGGGEVLGYLLGGTIAFSQGGTTEGAPVVGRFDSVIYSSPF